jgi:haloacetate dehalogenase
MKRRIFLEAVAAASATALAAPAYSQTASIAYEEFESAEVKTEDNFIFTRRFGTGPGLLLIHGFPRTNLMWRDVAPRLAREHTVVTVDLRGYGRSGCPPSTDDHEPYTKRAMAQELVSVMAKLGFQRFSIVGHDRGGRVAYRLALDRPDKVENLAVFDVLPISEAWNRADAKFAQTYWPWSLLSQKPPLPEEYLLAAPAAVFDNPFGGGSFSPEIKAAYAETYRDPARVHAICEEYRAAATLDRVHDENDQRLGNRIHCPMLHLWASGGPLDSWYDRDGGALGVWRKWADNVQGQAIKGGHFFPEENPIETSYLIRKFLLG